MNYQFETDRLGFRSWQESDFMPFSKMNQDPDVMKYFTKTLTEEQTRSFIERITKGFEKHGYGLWAIEHKPSGQFAGFLGLNYTDFPGDFTPCTEIGWRLAKEFWGQGLATEGAREVLTRGFEIYGLEEIFSFTSVGNLRSENVMKKIGMQKEMEFLHPNIPVDHELCRHVLYKKIPA